MDKGEEAPILEEIGNLFPPSTLVANSISMKLPAFWPDTAEVWFCSVHYQERNCFQDKVLPPGSCPTSGSCLPDPGPYQRSSCWPPKQGTYEATNNLVLSERLSRIRGSGIPSSLQGPETRSSDEPDVSSSSH